MHNFRGCYHYDSAESLERALVAAREYLYDEEISELDAELFTMFRRKGSTLLVDASLPMSIDRYFVVAVLGMLAWHARDGVVEAYRGSQLIDRILSAGQENRAVFDQVVFEAR
jgi:hypothetical protein